MAATCSIDLGPDWANKDFQVANVGFEGLAVFREALNALFKRGDVFSLFRKTCYHGSQGVNVVNYHNVDSGLRD